MHTTSLRAVPVMMSPFRCSPGRASHDGVAAVVGLCCRQSHLPVRYRGRSAGGDGLQAVVFDFQVWRGWAGVCRYMEAVRAARDVYTGGVARISMGGVV